MKLAADFIRILEKLFGLVFSYTCNAFFNACKTKRIRVFKLLLPFFFLNQVNKLLDTFITYIYLYTSNNNSTI